MSRQASTEFGRWLTDARGRAGMTQRELSAASGVHLNTIQKLEAGETQRPRAQVVAKLEASLGEESTDETRQQAILQRLDGMTISRRQLAAAAGIDRKTLERVIQGDPNVRASTYAAIESWLAELEDQEHRPSQSSAEGLVTFRVSGNCGVEVVVQGPVSNLTELEASVGRLIQRIGEPQREEALTHERADASRVR